MKILRFDSVGGASGDMILAALFDLGIDMQVLREQVVSLPMEPFDIQEKSFSDHDLNGRQVTVKVTNPGKPVHRNLDDVRQMINKSGLSDRVKAMSVKIFERLAGAEAKVHDKPVDKIHFHEVGAVDSIVDITASCAALEMLGVDEVAVGPLPLGCGTVECEHGVLPVPVPATVELLKGHTVVQTDEPFELVTPTGAAILTAWKGCSEVSSCRGDAIAGRGSRKSDGREKGRKIGDVGHGFGHRKLNGRPNLLRAIIVESTDHSLPSEASGRLLALAKEVRVTGRGRGGTTDRRQEIMDECLVLECNIDDTVPELLGSLSQKLLEKGALDVFTTSVQMKKQRPGTLLTVLCVPGDRESFLEIIFTESTTFGVREYMTRRTVLERRHVDVETPYGTVRVKIGSWKGRDITRSPEHDDCVQCAEAHNVPVRTVYEAACSAAGM